MALAMMASAPNERVVHPFFAPKTGTASDIENEQSPHDGPRKRQRMSPSEHEIIPSQPIAPASERLQTPSSDRPRTTVIQQLRSSEGSLHSCDAVEEGLGMHEDKGQVLPESAYPKGRVNDQQPAVTFDGSSEYNANEVKTTPPKKMLRIRSDGKLASPKAAQTEISQAANDAEVPVPGLDQQTQKTTPKKTLRIRPDGKLASPVTAPVEEPKQRAARGRPKKLAKPQTGCLVKIRYGHDRTSQQSLGQKIQEIMADSIVPKALSTAKQSEPQKPTHPFFLGAKDRSDIAKTTQNLEVTPENSTDSPRSNSRSKFDDRIKARVTSKPPGTIQAPDLSLTKSVPIFGTDHARLIRFPGACEPIWPPAGMLNVGAQYDQKTISSESTRGYASRWGQRKLKSMQIQIAASESVLHPYGGMACTSSLKGVRIGGQIDRKFRQPRRLAITSVDLQAEVQKRMLRAPWQPSGTDTGRETENHLARDDSRLRPTHKAIDNAFSSLLTSRTAFDRFECESQDWCQKYAPRSAEQVLQSSRDAIILRDWLLGLKVVSTSFKQNNGQGQEMLSSSKRGTAKSRRKRKKREDELDDFIVSSDDEADLLGEVSGDEEGLHDNGTGKRSVLRQAKENSSQTTMVRSGNVMLISGPHGCGKTAAIYAVAKELGFEIFEINAGSRRSGKDIIDKVGDMTRNHLVKAQSNGNDKVTANDNADMEQLDKKLQDDLNSGRQGTMNKFFQKAAASKTQEMPSKAHPKDYSPKKSNKRLSPKKKAGKDEPPKPSNQKQSLILFEEVDVIFEEDKSFWTTTLDLIQNSKRPVVLTCSDEGLLPLDDIQLSGILRFSPTPENLAVDYMLLVAANEGHLLSSEPLAALYAAKGSDLRASIIELQLFCQIGIGDRKGGLEWMLIDEAKRRNANRSHKALRVVSEDTYQYGMGWLGGEAPAFARTTTFESSTAISELLWAMWDINLAESDGLYSQETAPIQVRDRASNYQDLVNLDRSFDTLSASHILPASVTQNEQSTKLDLSASSLSNCVKHNFVEGLPLLQADPYIDQTGISESIALALQMSAQPSTKHMREQSDPLGTALAQVPRAVQERMKDRAAREVLDISTLKNLASDLGTLSITPTSIIESGIHSIAEDIAPYVRTILAYDQRLEVQREQLESLLNHSGNEGTKKRKTRASLAALEGGDKGSTRREKWFPRSIDRDLIMRTGGEQWQEILSHVMVETAEGAVTYESKSMDGTSPDISMDAGT